ncbi:MAG: SDR family oxidoreductase [Pseudomonadales bacterium]|nr:SDR family oxidoreductase [Pseudomonadales bacterium]
MLTDKIGLVTGAGSGIGRACAVTMAVEGASVMVSDVDESGGQETVSLIRQAGGTAEFTRCDVRNSGETLALVTATVAHFGRLDCAVNNAGIAGKLGVPAADYPEDIWDQVMAINLTGVWYCMKHEIKQMQQQGGGAIVNMSSAAGLIGLPNAAYTASKHGVVGLTKSAAVTYSAENIRINSVCPGYVPTPAVQPALDAAAGMEDALIAMHPMGRLGTEEEIANAVVWLCSDKAGFMAGHALAVDGALVVK